MVLTGWLSHLSYKLGSLGKKAGRRRSTTFYDQGRASEALETRTLLVNQITQVFLINDTGTNGDRITSDSRIGVVFQADSSGSPIDIQVDQNADGFADSFTSVWGAGIATIPISVATAGAPLTPVNLQVRWSDPQATDPAFQQGNWIPFDFTYEDLLAVTSGSSSGSWSMSGGYSGSGSGSTSGGDGSSGWSGATSGSGESSGYSGTSGSGSASGGDGYGGWWGSGSTSGSGDWSGSGGASGSGSTSGGYAYSGWSASGSSSGSGTSSSGYSGASGGGYTPQEITVGGLTARSDRAVISQASSPVVIDVLANDLSSDGGLTITAISNATGGSAVLISPTPNATGPSSRPRVSFTPSAGFTGGGFQYTVEDAAGAQATVSVSVSSLFAAPVLTSSGTVAGNSQMTITGGLAGSGYQASPFAMPTLGIRGNFEWHEIRVGDFSSGGVDPALGTQTMVIDIVATWESDNSWSISESYVWTYDIEFSNSEGDSADLHGGYSLSFFASVSNGFEQMRFSVDTLDAAEVTEVSGTGNSIFTLHASNSMSTHRVVEYDSKPNMTPYGKEVLSINRSLSTSGAGTYAYPLTGGMATGTTLSNASFTWSSSAVVLWTKPGAEWEATGLYQESQSGNSTSSYSGGGSYGYSGFAGEYTEDSNQFSRFNFMAQGMLILGHWELTGSGSASGGSSENRSYSGLVVTSVNTPTFSLTTTEHQAGGSQSSDRWAIAYDLADSPEGYLWDAVGGTGSGSGSSYALSTLSGEGGYTRIVPNLTETNAPPASSMYGATTQSADRSEHQSYQTTAYLDEADQWLVSGAGSGSSAHSETYSFSGTGNYNVTRGRAKISGNHSEHGDQVQSGHTEYTLELPEGGQWRLVSGTADETSSNTSYYEYDGSGGYSYATSGPRNYLATVSGHQTESGNTFKRHYESVGQSYINGQWIMVSGDIQDSFSTVGSGSSEGGSEYSYSHPMGGRMSGETTDNSYTLSMNSVTVVSTYTAGQWRKSGTAFDSQANRSTQTTDGDGSFTKAINESGFQSTTSGTMVEHSEVYRSSSENSVSTLGDDGEWTLATGRSSSTDYNHNTFTYEGSGTYSKRAAMNGVPGGWFIEGATTSSGGNESTSRTTTDGNVASGDWVYTGHQSASGSSSGTTTYHGTGLYIRPTERIVLEAAAVDDRNEDSHDSWSTWGSLERNPNYVAPDPNYPSASAQPKWRWTENGEATGYSHTSSSASYTVNTTPYTRSIPGGQISGQASAYHYFADSRTTDYTTVLNSAGDWVLDDGEATETQSSGSGVTISGAGSFSQNGWWNGQPSLVNLLFPDWSFSGTVSESLTTFDGQGTYAKLSVNDSGQWVLAETGASNTTGRAESLSFSGSGQFSDGNWLSPGADYMGGTFTQSHSHDTRKTSGFSISSSGQVSGNLSTSASGSDSFSQTATGIQSFNGARGVLTKTESVKKDWKRDAAGILAGDAEGFSESDITITESSGTDDTNYSSRIDFAGNSSVWGILPGDDTVSIIGGSTFSYSSSASGRRHSDFSTIGGEWEQVGGSGNGNAEASYRGTTWGLTPRYGRHGTIGEERYDSEGHGSFSVTTSETYDLTPDGPVSAGAGSGSASGSGSAVPRWVTTGSGAFNSTYQEASNWSVAKFVTSASMADWISDWLSDPDNVWGANEDDLEVVPDDGLNYSYTLYRESATTTRRVDAELTLTYGEDGWIEDGVRYNHSTATNDIAETTSTWYGHDWQSGAAGYNGGFGGTTPDGTMSLQRFEGWMAPSPAPNGSGTQSVSTRGSTGQYSNLYASRSATSTLVDTATDGVWSGWTGLSFDTVTVTASNGSFTAGDYQRTFDAGAGLVEGHYKSQSGQSWNWTSHVDTTFVNGVATPRASGSGSGGEGSSYEYEGSGGYGDSGSTSGSGSGSDSGGGSGAGNSGTISERMQSFNGLTYSFSWDGDDWTIVAGTDPRIANPDVEVGEGGSGNRYSYDYSYAGHRSSSNSSSSSWSNGDQAFNSTWAGNGTVSYDYKIQSRQNSEVSIFQSRIDGVYTAGQSSSGSGMSSIDYRQTGSNQYTGSTYVLDSWHEETTESSGDRMFDYSWQSLSQSSGSSWSNSYGAGGMTTFGSMQDISTWLEFEQSQYDWEITYFPAAGVGSGSGTGSGSSWTTSGGSNWIYFNAGMTSNGSSSGSSSSWTDGTYYQAGRTIQSFQQLLAENAPSGFGGNGNTPILVLQQVDYTFKEYTGLLAPVGAGLEPVYQDVVAAFTEAERNTSEGNRSWEEHAADWLLNNSGLADFDPELADSLRSPLVFAFSATAATTPWGQAQAVYQVGTAIYESYKDTAVAYYNAGGGGVNGVLLAISGVTGVAGLAEGWYGYDIGTGEQLSGWGRAGKFLEGGLAVFGVAGATAKAVQLAGKGIAGARVALGNFVEFVSPNHPISLNNIGSRRWVSPVDRTDLENAGREYARLLREFKADGGKLVVDKSRHGWSSQGNLIAGRYIRTADGSVSIELHKLATFGTRIEELYHHWQYKQLRGMGFSEREIRGMTSLIERNAKEFIERLGFTQTTL